MLGCNGRCGYSCCCCSKKSAQPQNQCVVVNDLKDWRFWDRRRIKKKPLECKKSRCLSIQFCAPKKKLEFLEPAPYDDGLNGIFTTKKLPDIPLTASHCENLNKLYLNEDWRTQFNSSDEKNKTTKKLCPFSKDWMQEHSKYYADIVSPPVIALSSNKSKRKNRLESDV